MTVLTIDCADASLRGLISQIFLELKPGVFVGNVSRLVREHVWDVVSNSTKHNGAVMVYSAPTEQGFDFIMCGTPTRSVVSYDDLKLILQSGER